jgi:hypothetical protein
MEMGRRRSTAQANPRDALELPELAVLYAHAQYHGVFYATHRLDFHSFAHTKFYPPSTYRLLTPNELLADFQQRNLTPVPVSTRISFMLATYHPSSPQRLPVADIWYYIITPDGEEHTFGIINYAAFYACQRFVLDTLADHDYKWINATTIEVVTPTATLRIKSSKLEEIFEYEPTPEQSRFRFEYPDTKLIHRLNNFDQLTPPVFTHVPAETKPERPAKTNHDPHKSRKAPTTPNATTVAQIADSLNISSNKARNILRSSNEPKPPSGRWEYTDAADIERITALLRNNA